jgi:hypothetical protein
MDSDGSPRACAAKSFGFFSSSYGCGEAWQLSYFEKRWPFYLHPINTGTPSAPIPSFVFHTKRCLFELNFNKMSSKKRPGYQAGSNLVALDDPSTWERVERHSEEVIESIPNLQEYEDTLEEYRSSQRKHFTKAELEKIILWKHTVGKSRPANRKLMENNSDSDVQQHTASAIAIARSIEFDDCFNADGSLSTEGKKSIQDAIACMDKLKGIGPAGASAVLSLIRPDIFCYFYDEVIDCFEAKRDYKISNYLRVNARCLQIARKLGGEWNARRVSKTVWVASRFLALQGEDLSSYISNENGTVVVNEEVHGFKEGDNEEEKVGAVESKPPQNKRLRNSKK